MGKFPTMFNSPALTFVANQIVLWVEKGVEGDFALDDAAVGI